MNKEILQAQEEIPIALYEKPWFQEAIYVGTGAVIIAGYNANRYDNVGIDVKDEKDALIRIAAVAAVTIGSIMDIVSSVKIADLNEQGQKLGMEAYQEGNPLFGEFPEREDFHSLKNLHGILSLSSPVLAAIAPVFGLAAGLGRGLAALNNERKAKRLKRAIEIKRDVFLSES